MRVVVADDAVLLREGVVRILEDAGFEVVGQAGTAEELMLKVRSYNPNVAIVDTAYPLMSFTSSPRSINTIASSEKDEKVVKPPSTPTAKKSLASACHSGSSRAISPMNIPISTDPTTFTASVA